MKKLIYLLAALCAVTACQKDPDMSELSDDYMVYTSCDPTFFKGAATPATNVYIPDAITDVDADDEELTWSDEDAQKIISVFRTRLQAMGYNVEYPDPETADLKLNLTFTEDVTLFIDYPDYWWWDWGGYWPYWYYPYPYPYVYGYAVASLVGELVKPVQALTPSETSIPVVWNVYIGGPDYGGKHDDTPYFVTGAGRAFDQSQYMKKN